MTHRVYKMAFARIHAALVAKAERKGRTRAEVDRIVAWLTGHDEAGIASEIAAGTDFETFFARAPRLNPARTAVTGTICGVRVEEVEEPTMRLIRILDKMIDELARGKAMEKILRGTG
jgi:hypothetical protein